MSESNINATIIYIHYKEIRACYLPDSTPESLADIYTYALRFHFNVLHEAYTNNTLCTHITYDYRYIPQHIQV